MTFDQSSVAQRAERARLEIERSQVQPLPMRLCFRIYCVFVLYLRGSWTRHLVWSCAYLPMTKGYKALNTSYWDQTNTIHWISTIWTQSFINRKLNTTTAHFNGQVGQQVDLHKLKKESSYSIHMCLEKTYVAYTNSSFDQPEFRKERSFFESDLSLMTILSSVCNMNNGGIF